MNISAACEAAGIRRRTYNETRQKDPDFAQAVDDARLSLIDGVEVAMVTRALGPNGHRDGIALLERYSPEWRTRKEPSSNPRPLVFSPALGTLAVFEGNDDESEG